MQFRSVVRALAGAVLAFQVSAAVAQEPAKDHLAAAKAAIESSKMFESVDGILINLALQTKSMLTKGNPTLGPQIDEVTNKVALDLAARRPELDKQLQTVWATRFTKAELEELAKFFASPTGKKWTGDLAKLIGGSGQVIQDWQGKISEDMLNKVKDEMKKRGHQL